MKMLFAAVALALSAGPSSAAEPQIGHMVYFQLKDRPRGRKKLVAACNKYLKSTTASSTSRPA